MDEEMEYECPECGAYYPAGAKRCPGCGKEFDLEGEEEGIVEEVLEEIIPESMVSEEEAEVEEEEPEEIAEPPEEAVEEEPEEEAPEEEVPEELEEIPPEEILEEVPPIALKKPKLYGGLFSVLGLAFVVLTVLALIATVIALRWDTWINGAAEETIGDYQMNFVYLGIAGIVVCAVVSVLDILRHRKGQRG